MLQPTRRKMRRPDFLMLVSVIIPIHDRFEAVYETIASVLEQTYRPIEIILIDDASTPRFEIVDTIANPDDGIFIKLCRSEQNIGPGPAREIGRTMAQGDYICYLDSDDLWAVNFIEEEVKTLRSNPNLGMCYCKTAEFEKLPITGEEKLRRRNNETFDTILPTLFYGRPWSTSACMWTREAVQKIGPWINTYTWEDMEYDFRAGLKGIQICHLPEILCYKRNHPDLPQLSNIPRRQAVLQQYCSVIEMSKSLTALIQSVDAGIRDIFVYKILRPVFINLIELGEYESAKEISRYMKIISSPLSKKWLLSNSLFFLLHFRDNPVGNTFLRRAVNRIS